MQVVLDEARAAYPPEIVVELQSEEKSNLEENVSRMVQWIQTWRESRE